MIRKVGFDQSSISSAELEGPSRNQAPNASPSGIAGYTDNVETANATAFDFSHFGNPASDRSIIVVGGKSHAGEITFGSSDGIQLDDANFEGAHSSLSGDIGTQSTSLKDIPGNVVDETGNIAEDFGTLRWDYAFEALGHDAWSVVDDAGSAIGIGDVTDWIGGVASDTGDAFKSAASDTADAAADGWDEAARITADAMDSVRDAFNSIGSFAGDMISGAGKTASDAVDTGGAIFQGAIDAVVGTGGDLIQTIGDAAEDVGNWMVNAAEDTADWVGGAVDDLF